MDRGRPTLGVLLPFVLAACAACGASTAPTAAPVATNVDTTNSPGNPSPAPTPQSSPDPTPIPVPPKPTGVSFEETRVGDEAPTTQITQTVKWGAPTSEGIEIRVYGVTECLAKPANPTPNSHGPCLVEHTPLPASVRTLLATAPAPGGVASWTWTGTFDCEVGMAYDPDGPAYHAVVLAAYSASDHSIFAIAEPGGWSEPGPDDIVC